MLLKITNFSLQCLRNAFLISTNPSVSVRKGQILDREGYGRQRGRPSLWPNGVIPCLWLRFNANLTSFVSDVWLMTCDCNALQNVNKVLTFGSKDQFVDQLFWCFSEDHRWPTHCVICKIRSFAMSWPLGLNLIHSSAVRRPTPSTAVPDVISGFVLQSVIDLVITSSAPKSSLNNV